MIKSSCVKCNLLNREEEKSILNLFFLVSRLELNAFSISILTRLRVYLISRIFNQNEQKRKKRNVLGFLQKQNNVKKKTRTQTASTHTHVHMRYQKIIIHDIEM